MPTPVSQTEIWSKSEVRSRKWDFFADCRLPLSGFRLGFNFQLHPPTLWRKFQGVGKQVGQYGLHFFGVEVHDEAIRIELQFQLQPFPGSS